jgi:putative hydrolases of HD superfamily
MTGWVGSAEIRLLVCGTHCVSRAARRVTTVSEDATAVAAFAFELGVLKRIRRSGWWHAGVRDPESVAEHTMRVAQLAGIIAAEEGADPARSAFLALWHDSQETRTGDLPHTAAAYLTKPDPRQITTDQTAKLPPSARNCPRRCR